MAETPKTTPRVVVVGPDEGQRISAFGSTVTVKLRGSDTQGAWDLTHLTVPGNFVDAAPPPHYQTREEETFYILKGTITFLAGDRTIRAPAGTLVKIPRNLIHKFSNPDSEPAELLVMGSPGNLAEFLVETYEVLQRPGPPDIPAVIAIFAKYGLIVVPPGGGPPPAAS